MQTQAYLVHRDTAGNLCIDAGVQRLQYSSIKEGWLERGMWYIVGDDGWIYDKAFADPNAALEYAVLHYGYAVKPTFNTKTVEFDGPDGVNIMLADHIYLHEAQIMTGV